MAQQILEAEPALDVSVNVDVDVVHKKILSVTESGAQRLKIVSVCVSARVSVCLSLSHCVRASVCLCVSVYV